MLDVLNERLAERGEDRIAFDHDCREGICGACGFMINGEAHGPRRGTTVCQLHMRHFKDGEVLRLEPWRSTSPSLKWRMCSWHTRSEEHTSELQSHLNLVCRLLLEKKKTRRLTVELWRFPDVLICGRDK